MSDLTSKLTQISSVIDGIKDEVRRQTGKTAKFKELSTIVRESSTGMSIDDNGKSVTVYKQVLNPGEFAFKDFENITFTSSVVSAGLSKNGYQHTFYQAQYISSLSETDDSGNVKVAYHDIYDTDGNVSEPLARFNVISIVDNSIKNDMMYSLGASKSTQQYYEFPNLTKINIGNKSHSQTPFNNAKFTAVSMPNLSDFGDWSKYGNELFTGGSTIKYLYIPNIRFIGSYFFYGTGTNVKCLIDIHTRDLSMPKLQLMNYWGATSGRENVGKVRFLVPYDDYGEYCTLSAENQYMVSWLGLAGTTVNEITHGMTDATIVTSFKPAFYDEYAYQDAVITVDYSSDSWRINTSPCSLDDYGISVLLEDESAYTPSEGDAFTITYTRGYVIRGPEA